MQVRNFDDAFTLLIGNESGYSNNPADPGGETMWGVTKRVAVAQGYTGAMRDLPLGIAKAIAKREYWDRFQCDQYDPEIGFQVFDAAYNGGHPVQWLQLAAGVNPDGVIGALSVAAIRGTDRRVLITRFDSYRLDYLADLAIAATFGRGWMHRIARNLREGVD